MVFMIYLAHFDFVEDGLGSDESHGYFTCMVEAINIDDALDKFKALLLTLRKEEDVLDEVEEVFLDSCIEIHSKLGGEKAFPLAKVPGTARILSKTDGHGNQRFLS